MTTATEITDPGFLEAEQVQLRAKLARMRLGLRLQMALEFALDAVSVLVATAALLVFLDWWFRLGLTARHVLLVVALLGVLPFCVYRAVIRWRAARLDDLSLAMMIDGFRPGTGGRIADVLQLPQQIGQPFNEVSPAMIRLAVRQAGEALAQSDWATLWNRRRTALRAFGLLAAILVPTIFASAAPRPARLSVDRWLLGSNERWPQKTYLTVTGLVHGNRLLAPRDEPFTMEVRADLPGLVSQNGKWLVPGRGAPLLLRDKPVKPFVPETVRVSERTSKGGVRDTIMTATGPASFRNELPPSSASTTFDLTAEDDWLGPITVERVDRPALAVTKLRVKEPGSPGNEFRAVENSLQQPVFLPDTEVELTLVGDQPLADARLTVHPGQAPKLTRVDDKSFSARWTLREALTLEVELTSRETGLTSKPAYLSIGILKDREPRITLRALGIGPRVTPVATIPLSIAATDDFGLGAVRIQAERTATDGEKGEPKTTKKTIALPLVVDPAKPVLDHQARQEIELQAETPAIGTVLRFVAEAEDRCARGVQVGRSSPILIQVVSANELFYEILLRQRAERAKFVAVLDIAEKQTPLLASTPTADTYATVMRALHPGSRQLELTAGRIADTLQEMKLNQVGSPKSHRLLQEAVIDPIRALNAGPIGELRGVLLSLSGSGSRGGATPDDARRLHGAVVNGMKTILEQMSQWESFVDVVNQVAEVIKMQQNVLQSAEKARESRTQEVFDAKP